MNSLRKSPSKRAKSCSPGFNIILILAALMLMLSVFNVYTSTAITARSSMIAVQDAMIAPLNTERQLHVDRKKSKPPATDPPVGKNEKAALNGNDEQKNEKAALESSGDDDDEKEDKAKEKIKPSLRTSGRLHRHRHGHIHPPEKVNTERNKNIPEEDIPEQMKPQNKQASILRFPHPEDGDDASFNTTRPEACFITSSYGSRDKMDTLMQIENESPYLRFYLFTNLKDDEWNTPGWEKIITNFTYRRAITHSRFGKFLGWKLPQIRQCRGVFYIDSCVHPTQNVSRWRELAATMEASPSGIMQNLHPDKRPGIEAEFEAIVYYQKDIAVNTKKALKWMRKQPDFDPNTTLYHNRHFGWSPSSQVFQKVSQTFWDRYSQELDSWRDQPLWSFMLHRFDVTPIPFPYEKKDLWELKLNNFGHGGHAYHSEADVAANFVPISIINKPETEEKPAQPKPTKKPKTPEDDIPEQMRPQSKEASFIRFPNPDGDDHVPLNDTKPEACFITSSYGSLEKMDTLVQIENRSPYLRFFLFTNLNDDEWSTPGWEKIVTNFTFRRAITHSRYGKFLGWKYPQIQQCRGVFYIDSCVHPIQKELRWRELAATMEASPSGIMQNLHPDKRPGIEAEFEAIVYYQKDIAVNTKKALEWMKTQPDFDPNTTLYHNRHFGWNPNSKVFRKVSQAFWDRYSQELDSWRDQPLWSFMLHRFNVTPMPFPYEKKDLWELKLNNFGHGGHAYHSEADVAANWLDII